MEKLIGEILEKHRQALEIFFRDYSSKLLVAAEKISQAMASGHKLLLIGNGGSAADAQHIAAEFVNRFLKNRRALPAIALTTDTSILTSIANDSSFAKTFSRQVEALGSRGDILMAISTSGESDNILEAIKSAKSLGIKTIGLLGKKGGRALHDVDVALVVSSDSTPRIQEIHILIGHILCELVEKKVVP